MIKAYTSILHRIGYMFSELKEWENMARKNGDWTRERHENKRLKLMKELDLPDCILPSGYKP